MLKHISNLRLHLREGGISGGIWWLNKLWHRHVTPPIEGVNIFQKDWNLLIILDGCDPTWIQQISDDTEWLPDSGDQKTLMSVGSTSREWYSKTLGECSHRSLSETAIISANPLAKEFIPDEIGMYEDLSAWAWDESLDIVPAHTVTDTAIKLGRETDYEQYVVHYMQPHIPFLKTKDGRRDVVKSLGYSDCWNAWYDTMKGNMSSDELKCHYQNNLKYVLPEVQILINNFAAPKTIISSDHSNAVGQKYMYGHPGYVQMLILREVPYIIISAEDEQLIEPSIDRHAADNLQRKKQLDSLGYL
jgi:hypothetical protein